jgi:hypothetical protein
MVCFSTTLLRSHPAHARDYADWRVPAYPEVTSTFAAYVRTLTWLIDNPAPAALSSVHRTALADKEHGQRLGASTSTGAIQALVGVFPVTELGVVIARDGTPHPSDVFSVSFGLAGRTRAKAWGERGVVVLVGLRLQLDGVNLTYRETIEVCARILIIHVVLMRAHADPVHASAELPHRGWAPEQLGLLSWCASRQSIVPRPACAAAEPADVELGRSVRARGRRHRGPEESAQGQRQSRWGSPVKSASAGWCPDSEDNPLTPGLGMTLELRAPPPLEDWDTKDKKYRRRPAR